MDFMTIFQAFAIMIVLTVVIGLVIAVLNLFFNDKE